MQLKINHLLALVIFTLCMSNAHADLKTITMQATATLSSTCNISSLNMSFGTFNPTIGNEELTATGTITTTCSNELPYELSLSKGTGTYSARTLNSANPSNTDKLTYNVYTGNDYSQIFGDGTDGSVIIASTGTGQVITQNIYAKLYRNQYVAPDIYSEMLTLTMSY